jgi:hypothetical protein
MDIRTSCLQSLRRRTETRHPPVDSLNRLSPPTSARTNFAGGAISAPDLDFLDPPSAPQMHVSKAVNR